MPQNIAVVIGVGGMGQAIARHIGSGTHLVLADFNQETLDAVAKSLRDEGYEVTSAVVDVSSAESVAALAAQAAAIGEVRSVVHTAGLSPVQAPVPAVLAVDLLGVALVLDEFGKVVAPGGAGVVIASMAAYHHPAIAAEDALLLATTPSDELLSLPILDPTRFANSSHAYGYAKQANLLRIQAASNSWGERGARINAISPGVIATPMGQAELNGQHAAVMNAMIDASNAKRVGTPADIAAATAFLLGPAAGFISGTDLLVDGGVVAAVRTGRLG
ncbi:SDR family oxidoreductase [Streptomyces sp. SID12501]|uniref:SDR family oxidoreductase n=1 Tax=Streptomyces sp. SID12501 TaxID=2706042 RepID=A0A6B3BXY2_9ACTN|nr:SDR family oxidoreductase [Streptomyces sp. SID12501]NEC89301.1 SDR family oxidoreductase [Streptomyces sp. SID12501]